MLGKLLILLLGEIVAREVVVGEVAVGEVTLGKVVLGLSNLVSDSELKSLYSSGRRNVESKY